MGLVVKLELDGVMGIMCLWGSGRLVAGGLGLRLKVGIEGWMRWGGVEVVCVVCVGIKPFESARAKF